MNKSLRRGRAFLLAAAMITLAGAMSGCGKKADAPNHTQTQENKGTGEQNGGEEKTAKTPKIAMVAAGVFGDQGMNDALLNGMKEFTRQTGIEVTSVEISEFSDHAINARNFAQQGYDLVLMGGPVSEIIPEIAAEYPDTHFLLNKGTIGDMDNVTSVQFDEAGGGFLAGAFAVLMDRELGGEGKVGWVGGERIPDLEKARYAFSAAAEYMGGQCSVVYVGSFTDIAKGKEIALQLYNDGAHIVQAYAGGASNGVYQAAEATDENHFAMGCATGQFELSPKKIMASSVVKYDEFFAQMLKSYAEEGTMAPGIVTADIKNGGTGLKYSPEIGDQVPEEIQDQIKELEEQIVSGQLTVPTTEEERSHFLETVK